MKKSIPENLNSIITHGDVAKNTTGYWPTKEQDARFYSDEKYREGFLACIKHMVDNSVKIMPIETWDEIALKYIGTRSGNYADYLIGYLKKNYEPPQKIKP